MRNARVKAMKTRRFCKTPLFFLTPISPYFLWLSTDHQTQMTDYMLQLLCMQLNNYLGQQCCSMIWSLDLSNGCSHWTLLMEQLLREALCSFNKAKKIINLMIIITILHYSMLDINHEPIFGEMTRICYLVRLFLKKFRTYFGKWGLYFY